VLEWLRRRRERDARDRMEAHYLIGRYGADASALAREWEIDSVSVRTRQHWRRIRVRIESDLKK